MEAELEPSSSPSSSEQEVSSAQAAQSEDWQPGPEDQGAASSSLSGEQGPEGGLLEEEVQPQPAQQPPGGSPPAQPEPASDPSFVQSLQGFYESRGATFKVGQWGRGGRRRPGICGQRWLDGWQPCDVDACAAPA